MIFDELRLMRESGNSASLALRLEKDDKRKINRLIKYNEEILNQGTKLDYYLYYWHKMSLFESSFRYSLNVNENKIKRANHNKDAKKRLLNADNPLKVGDIIQYFIYGKAYKSEILSLNNSTVSVKSPFNTEIKERYIRYENITTDIEAKLTDYKVKEVFPNRQYLNYKDLKPGDRIMFIFKTFVFREGYIIKPATKNNPIVKILVPENNVYWRKENNSKSGQHRPEWCPRFINIHIDNVLEKARTQVKNNKGFISDFDDEYNKEIKPTDID